MMYADINSFHFGIKNKYLLVRKCLLWDSLQIVLNQSRMLRVHIFHILVKIMYTFNFVLVHDVAFNRNSKVPFLFSIVCGIKLFNKFIHLQT